MTISVGQKAPDFTATAVYDEEFHKITLSDYINKYYVVLFFYPLDFTFVCPTEITGFSDKNEEFEKLSTKLFGISVDSEFSHLVWTQSPRKSGGLGFIQYPLISDLKKQISSDYGVLTEEGVALRGLFIIDKQGIIQHSTVNNLSFGRSVEETLRTLQAIQHCQKHQNEVCPVDWKPGEKTMTPSPVESKLYFEGK